METRVGSHPTTRTDAPIRPVRCAVYLTLRNLQEVPSIALERDAELYSLHESRGPLDIRKQVVVVVFVAVSVCECVCVCVCVCVCARQRAGSDFMRGKHSHAQIRATWLNVCQYRMCIQPDG